MLNLSHVTGATVVASDDTIGHVKSAFFDDRSWAIRYLVVDTGTWLASREVLISPYSVEGPIDIDKEIRVSLTREQVRGSPDVDTHQPVSRQHEREYLDYYAYPDYWSGVDMWGMGAYPLAPPYRPTTDDLAEYKVMRDQEAESADVHLRSSVAVSGYDMKATDGTIGHIEDFVFEEKSWAIRYLVINTRNWWPGGRRVLVATHWLDSIDWASRTCSVKLSRDQIKGGPEYRTDTVIDRDYEQRLHDAYGRQGYWDERPAYVSDELLMPF